MTTMRSKVSMLAVCVFLTSLGNIQAQVDAATFGGGLLIALNKAQDLVRAAQAAGNDLEIQAGVTAENAITSAQIAYKDSLTTTIDQLNEQQKKAYTDIDNLIKTAQQPAIDTAAKVMDQAQLIVAELPFGPKYPVLGAYSPIYAQPDKQTYSVTFNGIFKYSYNGRILPKITLNGQTFTASRWDDLHVTFDIPVAAFGTPKNDSLVIQEVKLSVPWDASKWYNIFNTNVEEGTFTQTFALLPLSPGKLQIFHNISTTTHEEKVVESGDFSFDSSSNDIEENRTLNLSAQDISDGWRIKPNTWSFDLKNLREGREGHDWYDKGYQSSTDTSVVWRARTEHKSFGTSGKIIWAIKCTVSRDKPVPSVSQPEDVSLSWGLSKIFQYPAGQWKAVWTKFDGSPIDYDKTDLTNAFFKVDATGDQFTVKTYTTN